MSEPSPEGPPPGENKPVKKKPKGPGPGNLLWIGLVGLGAAGIIALTVESNAGTEITLNRLRGYLDERGAKPGAEVAAETGIEELQVGRNALTFGGPADLDPDFDPPRRTPTRTPRRLYRVPIYSLGDAGRDRIVQDLDARGLPTTPPTRRRSGSGWPCSSSRWPCSWA